MRLIDADELLIDMGAGCMPIMEEGISGVTGDNDTIKDYIDRASTIDAEPVRHGRWVNKTEERHGLFDYRFDCSACGHIFWAAAVRDFNYCPNCGAKMCEEVQ